MLLPIVPATPMAPRQLLVSERGATRVVQVAEIVWLETADNYVALHTPGDAPLLLRQSLAPLLAQLGPDFVRCHRRAAVRMTAIARIEPIDKGDCQLALHGGDRVPCSRQFRRAVLARFSPPTLPGVSPWDQQSLGSVPTIGHGLDNSRQRQC